MTRDSTRRPSRTVALLILVALAAVTIPQIATAQYTKRSAGIGALLGLALGGSVVDVAAGAVLGAAGGKVANMATEDKRNAATGREQELAAMQARRLAEREADESRWQEMNLSDREQELLERERSLEEREKLLREVSVQVADVTEAADDVELAIIQAVGPDVWDGYKALRACRYDRALAMAKVADTSEAENHRLGGMWLAAMTAVDSRDSAKADTSFSALVENDPEIDTAQQASLATDQAILEMRAERNEIGIGACRASG